MANKIILKKSSVAAKVPLAGGLEVGEIAVNLADQKLYSKNAGGTVVLVGQGAGLGNVVGPASATDNALARFDGTTGKLIQNSVATLTDAGSMDVPNITIDYTQYDTAPTVTSAVGRMYWDSGNGSLSLGLKNNNVELKLGEQEYAFCYNDTGVAITKGQIVYINGAQGNRVSVLLAIATGDLTSGTTIGMVAESIAIGAEGWVQISGPIYKMNTLGLTAGAPIYLSPTVAGAYTTTKPVAPNHLVTLGFISRVDNIVGSIFIKVDNGYELDELHNVLITTPASGNTLIYDAVAGVWENANLTAGTGVSVTNGAGSITVANTGVLSLTGTASEIDVSASTGAVTLSLPATINANTTGSAATLTTGRTIAITGDLAYTSPSFNGSTNVTAAGTLATVNTNVGSFTNASVTVNAKGLVTAASSGTAPVTSVTGTSPVASSGGATPAISLSAAYGDTLNPYASKTANFVLAAPNGSAGVPTFRAVVAADIPTLNQNTTGSAATLTTGRTIAITGDLAYTSPSFNGSANVTAAGTLATVNANAGAFTNASITVNAKGLITAASSGAAAGTVTSVAATVPSFLSVTGSPITTTGTLAIAYSGTALPVLNGGTGVTTSTGTGSVVLSTSPTLVTPILGAASATSLSYSTTLTGGTGVVNLGSGQLYKDASGNVGIGTSSPSGKLDVKTAADSKLIFNDGSTTGNVRLEATNLAYSGYKPLELNGSVQIFATGGTERAKIDASGNFYVGTGTSCNLTNMRTASLAASGYQKMPNGLLIQWVAVGTTTSASGTIAFSWPVAFSSACYSALPACNSADSGEIGTTKSTSGGTLNFFGFSGISKEFIVVGIGF